MLSSAESFEIPTADNGPSTREWVLVSVTKGDQLGSPERLREKMEKVRKQPKAATVANQTERGGADVEMQTSQERERTLQAKIATLTQRATAAEERATTAEETVRRVTESERRAREIERMAQDRATAAEERASTAEETVRRITESERRAREIERMAQDRATTAEERASTAEETVRRVTESECRAREIERMAQDRATAAEERASTAEETVRRVTESERRAREIERMAQDRAATAEERASTAEETVRRVTESERRAREAERMAEDRATAAERAAEEAIRRAQEAERRAAEAGRRLQMDSQPFWVVNREEIEFTGEKLGEGGWAEVKVAKFRGARVAAKCLHSQIISHYNHDLFIREMNVAARVRHPNLLLFIGATLQGELTILTELMPTSLRALLEQGELPRQQLISIACDIAKALNYLHLMRPDPIIHRDVSSANVLLDHDHDNSWKAKVSDYGSANFLRQLRTAGPGNPMYAAPEANIATQQSSKMDIFSFGVVLVEMCTARFPDPATRERLILSIREPRLVGLVRQCTAQDKDRRPSAADIITRLTEL